MIADYIANHQNEFWLALGFALLALEVITGFSTGIFLFAGLAGDNDWFVNEFRRIA